MKFFTVAATLALALGVNANWKKYPCLSDADAVDITEKSIIFLEHKDLALARATGEALFSPTIQEFSDSINSLRGDPLGTQVEDGSTTYIDETLSTPPIPNIDTLSIVHNCNRVVWQWNFDGIGTGEFRIHGVTFIDVEFSGSAKMGYSYVVSKQYVEFNSLAWAYNTGFNITPPAYP